LGSTWERPSRELREKPRADVSIKSAPKRNSNARGRVLTPPRHIVVSCLVPGPEEKQDKGIERERDRWRDASRKLDKV